MAHHEFQMPVHEAQVRALRVNDTVTLQRTLYGIRDATQIHMFDRGRQARFDLNGHAVIHTAPNVKKVPPSAAFPAGYEPVCIGTGLGRHREAVQAGLQLVAARRFQRPIPTCGQRAQHALR